MTLFACILLAAPQEGPKAETVTLPDTKVSFDLVRVPGGKLGDVEVPSFAIGRHEVTWAEYKLYYESRKQAKVDGVTRPTQPDVKDPTEPFPNGAEQTARHPAVCIGWFGAAGYCEWLTKKTGRVFRLPTEAEWELAARAGEAGEGPADADAVAWHRENSDEQTHPVGGKKSNAWGLHDTLGNAWEHVLEPFAPPLIRRVVRGGAWHSPADQMRFDRREKVPDIWADSDPKRPLRLWWITDGPFVGFRVVAPEGALVGDAFAGAAGKVTVSDLELHGRGKEPDYSSRITGKVTWNGDRPLAELELKVHYKDEDGKTLWVDPKEKPVYNTVQVALGSSAHAGKHRAALKPGETREFEVEIPTPHDEAGMLDFLDQVGAVVTRLRYADR